jgi:hypothetical protein
MDWQAYQAWLAAGNTPTSAPVAPVAIPSQVSRRQFFQAAATLGIITEDEAESAVTGAAIPASLLTAIVTQPTADQFAARMAIKGATTFDRASPLLAELGPAMSQAPAQIDALFTLAASL